VPVHVVMVVTMIVVVIMAVMTMIVLTLIIVLTRMGLRLRLGDGFGGEPARHIRTLAIGGEGAACDEGREIERLGGIEDLGAGIEPVQALLQLRNTARLGEIGLDRTSRSAMAAWRTASS